MRLDALRHYLFPGEAERDEGFLQESFRISDAGLNIIWRAEITVAVLLVLGRVLLAGDPEMAGLLWTEALALILIGALTFAARRVGAAYPWSRAFGIVSVFLIGLTLIGFSLLMKHQYGAEDLILGQTTLVMLLAVAALPVRPAQTLALGLGLGAAYAGLVEWLAPSLGIQTAYLLFIVTLTLVSTGLTAVIYSQRVAGYQSYVQTVHALEGLRQAQSRMLLAENAASLGRLAAALSHELNSPIGALMSGVDTLLLLAGRQATTPPDKQERLVRLQAELRLTIQESAGRLEQIVRRMQRFANLDRAEVQEANLNDLIGDVCSLLEPQLKDRAMVELDLQPLPLVRCRPQQISAVFSNLLSNAADALPDRGRIVISTRREDSRIEVRISDDGRGMKPEQVAAAFDPAFKIADGRVSSGNWSLFNSRQIIREHGGEIQIASGGLGRGATVTITLPVETPNAADGVSMV